MKMGSSLPLTLIQDEIISIPRWVTITATNMSRKTMIMIGMIIGSVAGGYLPGLLGADGFSLTSLLGSGAGGILGIWIAFQLTR
jgi:outer membrane lipoprotein SlyB